MNEAAQPTTTLSPDKVVIDSAKTARELFIMGMQGNPGNLATAVSTKPGEVYTMNINIGLRFGREDVLAMLREAGYTVDFPGGTPA